MKQLLFASMMLLLLSFSAIAQERNSVPAGEPTVILTGVVYDINGAVVVSCTRVVAYNSAGKMYGSATDDQGNYKLELPSALYTVEVDAPGFCPAQTERFRVVKTSLGKMSLDFVLEVAESKEGCKYKFILDKKSKRPAHQKPRLIAE
jgi:hypothetical protein